MNPISAGGGDDSKITITGFKLTDFDLNVDLIKAHISSSSKQAKISLNQNKLNHIDFNSATYCHSSANNWTCLGPGYSTNEMVFLGMIYYFLFLSPFIYSSHNI